MREDAYLYGDWSGPYRVEPEDRDVVADVEFQEALARKTSLDLMAGRVVRSSPPSASMDRWEQRRVRGRYVTEVRVVTEGWRQTLLALPHAEYEVAQALLLRWDGTFEELLEAARRLAS